ncbi:MAG: fasciclin domain-containing protein [Sphingorhabdus sp.]
MKKLFSQTLILAALATAGATAVHAGPHKMSNPMVGGAAMMPAKNIVENASAAPNLTTLVAAVKAAGLVETLASPGPFTVFAPTDAAFSKLPASTVDALVMPQNKGTLTTVLTYHVVPGKFDSKAILHAIKRGGGKASFTTVQGQKLTAMMNGKDLILTDAKGGRSAVSTADVRQSNGIVHVIDSVLMP